MGPRKARVIDAWSSPPIVVLKFNVDDAAHGKLRPAGVGGILRNHTWEVLLMFSKYVEVKDLLWWKCWQFWKIFVFILLVS